MKKKILTGLSIVFIYYILLYILVLVEKDQEGASINSIFNAFWYSIITLSTVGYGDYFPVSTSGKVIGLVFVLGSLSLIGYLISLLTQKVQKYMEDKKTGQLGTKMENHVVIIGYDKFSNHIMKQIINTGKQIAIVTNRKDDIDSISNSFSNKQVFKLFAEFDNFDNLNKANILKAAKVFVNFSDDTEMLVYILNLKAHFNDIEIVVSLNNASLKSTFKSAGVLYAISREEVAAKLVASYIFEPEVAMVTEDVMSSASSKDEFDIVEYKIVDNNPYLGKDYDFVFNNMRKDYGGILLGIFKDDKLFKNPMQKISIEKDDYIILIANGESVSKIEKDFNVAQGR